MVVRVLMKVGECEMGHPHYCMLYDKVKCDVLVKWGGCFSLRGHSLDSSKQQPLLSQLALGVRVSTEESTRIDHHPFEWCIGGKSSIPMQRIDREASSCKMHTVKGSSEKTSFCKEAFMMTAL